jgi:PEP-CTERM motif
VEPWDADDTIRPQPDNQAPLSVRLHTWADGISWQMGLADATAPIAVNFFAETGALVHTEIVPLLLGYNDYSFRGFGAFAGLSIYNNNDPAGLRFLNFSYDSTTAPVPEPASLSLLGLGIVALGVARMRSRRA